MGTVRLRDEHGRTMHSWQIKKALGLPPKLPTYRGEPKLLGHIQGVPIWDFGQQKRGQRKHRLYAQVSGDRYVPAGRLHQYKD